MDIKINKKIKNNTNTNNNNLYDNLYNTNNNLYNTNKYNNNNNNINNNNNNNDWISESYISNKLLTFYNFLKDLNGNFIYVYIDEEWKDVLWEVLQARIEGDFCNETYTISNGKFMSYAETRVNMCILSDIKQCKLLSKSSKIISYTEVTHDTIFITKGVQYILHNSNTNSNNNILNNTILNNNILSNISNNLCNLIKYDTFIIDNYYITNNTIRTYKCKIVDMHGFSNNIDFDTDQSKRDFYLYVEEKKQQLSSNGMRGELTELGFRVEATTPALYSVQEVYRHSKLPIEFPHRASYETGLVECKSVSIGSVVSYYKYIREVEYTTNTNNILYDDKVK
ncbi:hypothetical protein EHP00_2171 [Ecytonucleospora hepatopenaei]|uniref:Uncharacterized protein n=1 Tax=Ecytonucleospora hepatopenaei TaxID=646526 RepID=A0A1W0E5B0_9MICR|nr:hypothetical protein EHP00_2171 [Ecytonucleospora hepatopenaei]